MKMKVRLGLFLCFSLAARAAAETLVISEGAAVSGANTSENGAEEAAASSSEAKLPAASGSSSVGVDTPLHEAAKKGNLVKSRKLLDAGADVDAPDSHGDSALVIAIRRKDIELVKTLLDYGASSSLPSGVGTSPIGVAVSTGDVVLVKLLLDRGTDVQKPDASGYTPLMHAVLADDLVVTQLLLHRGARFEGTAKDGRTIGEMVKPGSALANLPQFPRQIDAAAAVSSAETADSEEASSQSTAVSYQAVEERSQLTRVRLKAPVGTWKKRKQITLESVQVEARNVGEVAAADVKVTIVVPGGELVTLDGPTALDRNQAGMYSAKPGLTVTKTGNLKAEVSCSNCRR